LSLRRRETFTSSSGSTLAGHASPAQLRALVRVFGLCGARELAASTERPMIDALSGLHAMLAANSEQLSRVCKIHQVGAAHHITSLPACRG
jgi:hypothetical protein